jgi:Uma2 family endonuclease
MAFVLGDRPVRPLTADEVMGMVEAGILSSEERVELLHGVLTEKSVKSPGHEELKMRLLRWLDPTAEGHRVRVEACFVVPDRTSLPEPDLVAVPPGDYTKVHPSAALLAIEVASSSLKLDTTIKAALYAAADITDYWVVDVAAKRLRVFRDPGPDGYATETVLGPDGHAEPLNVELPPLDLAQLFDGL